MARVTVRRSGSGRNGATAGPPGGRAPSPASRTVRGASGCRGGPGCPSLVTPVTRTVIDSGPGRDDGDMAGQAGAGAHRVENSIRSVAYRR
jgi:hypothetical protein